MDLSSSENLTGVGLSDFTASSRVSGNDSDADLEANVLNEKLVKKLLMKFQIYKSPNAHVASDLEGIENALFTKLLKKRFPSYKQYKKTLVEQIGPGCKFETEVFRRSCIAYRAVLSREILSILANTNENKVIEVYESLPQDVRANLAIIVDILSVAPSHQRLLEWVARQLCHIQFLPEDFGCASDVKCLCLAKKRSKITKSPLFWAVLDNNNCFQLYDVDNLKPVDKRVKVDVISQSRSGRSLKIQSEPTTVDFIMVPEGENYDAETWTTTALRNDNVLYYSSMTYFHKPMIPIAIKAAEEVISAPSFLFARAVLCHEVVPYEKSQPVLNALFTIYSHKGMTQAFMSILAGMEFAHAPRMKSQILRGNSYLTSFFKIITNRFCPKYVEDVIKPIAKEVQKVGDLNLLSDEQDPKAVLKLMTNVFEILFQNIDKIPLPVRHVASVLKNVIGIHYGDNQAVFNGISGFFFLRFFSPILAMPDEYGIDGISGIEAICAFTQLFQALANLQTIPGKYVSLVRYNSKFDSLREKIYEFTMKIAELPEDPIYPPVSEDEITTAVCVIIQALSGKNQEFILNAKKEMLNSKTPLSWGVMHFLRVLATSGAADPKSHHRHHHDH